ncbi:hypothetical protein [Xylophilus sp. ASV27]|uniref:hypothetical protein n=1 Tax=Xylophilus sp. ASV27 TaxID=2795129 RepID=UPI0018EB9DF8|nr:hypothetical protein [Xylophilus sp. ASV27]
MRNMLDFSSWHALFTTAVGVLLASLLLVGLRLVFMQTIQRRRERENRQINERLKTLISAYKTLGGSFTGRLQVSPTHRRELPNPDLEARPDAASVPSAATLASSERQRRTRDAVEAALSDVILLGTEEQVQLAAQIARDMVAGRSIETAELVVSLRQFIRAALDLAPLPASVLVPGQGPLRPAGGGGATDRRSGPATGTEGSGVRAGGATGGGGAGGGMQVLPGDLRDDQGAR